MGSADELLASRDVERPQAACSVSCTIVSVERVSVFECCKDIRPRLSKDRRRVNTTFARVHTLTCHTRYTYCAVCASSIQATDRAYRGAHRATLGTAVAAALHAHVLPDARGSGGSGLAPALSRHLHAVLTGAHEHTFRPTNGRPCGSAASPDARATLPTRPTRPLPRALAARRACCALLPRPHPCPLPSLPTARSACPACARNCCEDESSGCHHRSG